MQNLFLQKPLLNRAGSRTRVPGSIVKGVAIVVLLAAIVGGGINFLNLVLDTVLPDPLQRSAQAAAPEVKWNASVVTPARAPANFSAQFPSPSGPVEPQPEAF